MKMQSSCGSNPTLPGLRQSFSSSQLMLQQVDNDNSQEVNEANILKPNLDNIEESLRDALRLGSHGNRFKDTKDEASEETPLCENTFTKHHNYITVYEHEQTRQVGHLRNAPNVSENTRPQTFGNPSITRNPLISSVELNTPGNYNSEEFRIYSSTLMERIQKMEKQNVQLLQFAEQQKAEYDKVAAQVVESENNQRFLLRECNNLKRQVQELADHNRRLREQKQIHDNQQFYIPSTSGQGSYNPVISRNDKNALRKDDLSAESARNLHGGAETNQQYDPSMSKCNSHEIANIVELYTALQKATINDLQASGFGQVSSPHQSHYSVASQEDVQSTSLDVIHEHPRGRRHPDYAVPSNKCAVTACTKCDAHSNARPPVREPQNHIYLPQSEAYSHSRSREPSRGFAKQQKPARNAQCGGFSKSQAFDNNSYEEVELKPGKQFADRRAERHDFVEPANTGVNFRRDNRLRRSHNHYKKAAPKIAEPQRPSSLILDLESTQSVFSVSAYPRNQFQPVSPAGLTLSPLSPKENSETFGKVQKNQNNNNRGGLTQIVVNPNQSLNNQNTDPGSKLSKALPSQCSSALPINDLRQAQQTKRTSNARRRSTSRSSSVTDLPPPPPPPPQSDDEEEFEHSGGNGCRMKKLSQTSISARSRSNSADTEPADPTQIRTKFNRKEELRPKINEGFPRKLSVWKQQDKANPRPLTEQKNSSQPDSSPAAWRRCSYSAACRKSQSLDHLYEQVLRENEKQRQSPGIEKDDHVQTTEIYNSQQNDSHCSDTATCSLPTNNSGNENFLPSGEELTSSSCELPSAISNTETPRSKELILPLKPGSTSSFESAYISKSRSPTAQVNGNRFKPSTPTAGRLQKLTSFNISFGFQHPKGSSNESSSEFEIAKTSVLDDSPFDDQVFVAKPRLPSRRLSEGSTGNRQKDKLANELERPPLRRHRSVGSDVSINKRKDGAALRYQAQSVSRLDSSKFDSSYSSRLMLQSRVSLANSQSKLQAPSVKSKTENNKTIQKAQDGSSIGKQNDKLAQSKSAQESKSLSSGSFFKSKYSLGGAKANESVVKTDTQNSDTGRGRSAVKNNKKNKDLSNETNQQKSASKSGSSQSKSLVNIMKAKFARSASAGRSSSSGKRRNIDDVRISSSFEISPIKPLNKVLDPRTLSLEPNSYLPPGKDGTSIRKASKQMLGSRNNIAVGRKLSQPFPNGISEDIRQPNCLHKVSEEVLSDEGFAEGSTIERADKDAPAVSCDETTETQLPQRLSTSSRIDQSFTTSTPNSGNSQMLNSKRQQPFKFNSNVTAFGTTTTTDTSSNMDNSSISPSRPDELVSTSTDEENAVNTHLNQSTYENFPVEKALTNKTSLCLSNDQILSGCMQNISRNEVLATGVTIIKTSANCSTSSVAQMSKVKPSMKAPKSITGGAFGRIIKTVSNHYSGSKEDLSQKRDSPNSTGKGKEFKKSKQSENEAVFEKAFINSVVQAELGQIMNERSSVAELKTPDSLKKSATCIFPPPLSSSRGDSLNTESIGTGSSFGSLPSDGLESSHSGDVIEFRGISSSCSSDSSLKHPAQRRNRNKRNIDASMAYGSQCSKTGTGESNASSSGSEVGFTGRSRLPGSGIRSPTVSSPISKDTNHPSKIISTASNVSHKRAVSADPYQQRKSPVAGEGFSRGNHNNNQATSPTKRSESASRLSKMPTPSKLPSPGKCTDNRGNGKKTGESVPPTSRSGAPTKTKLAPLNYGFPSANSGKARTTGNTASSGSSTEPVYENSSIIEQNDQSRRRKNSQSPNQAVSTQGQAQRSLKSTFGVPVSRTGIMTPTQVDMKRSKTSIPSTGGIHRSRPVYSGVGAG